MKTLDPAVPTDDQAKAELQEASERLARGIPFTDEEKARACERMDRMREENRRLFGESNIAVELIRETRDNA
jgi:hypothetical protein